MRQKKSLFILFLLAILQVNCSSAPQTPTIVDEPSSPPNDRPAEVIPTNPVVGAAQMDLYVPMLQNKKVALLVNQTSVVGETHLVDTLVALGIQVEQIFAPEHGFRGTADAGASIQNGRDAKTNLPILSLYGKKKKPAPEDLAGIDVVVFDIQDVGARFYTYISSMHYMMEACAENKILFLVLDRPNPNGHYFDGPTLDPDYQSFVGMHPVPVVHGMTVGEYAQMINGEAWLNNGIQCALQIVPCTAYTHNTFYELPIKPSPNLPNMHSIYLYPSLCFFEGTDVSVGRGTNTQFQVIGHPELEEHYSFTPVSMSGAKYPKHEGKVCRGYDLTTRSIMDLQAVGQLDLTYLLRVYEAYPDKEAFFNNFFDKLAGSDLLRKQLIAGKSVSEIRASWQADLAAFEVLRARYLLY